MSRKPARIAQAQRICKETFAALRAKHPDAHCELDHQSPFQLIVATVLSAQTTDVLVNQVTPELFRRWPTPQALAKAERGDVEQVLSRMGMFRQKAKNITSLAGQLLERHGGEVPRKLDELVALSGVGRKTANVVLGVAFGAPEGVVVDTHVQRISQRLGWTQETTPEKIESDLMGLFPREDWDMLSHTLIFHGRRICAARSPACAACPVTDACPNAFAAENVGRKPPRARRTNDGPSGGATSANKKAAKKAPAKASTTLKPIKAKAPKAKPAKPKPAKPKPATATPAALTKAAKPALPKQAEAKRANAKQTTNAKQANATPTKPPKLAKRSPA
ncbi:MAG: endonuclease III [Polyangiaceae bacterium]|nr:endonuclease III [Polyangiaceae bacterium]MCB9608579.1 endonuclease III [Polyangiaceae bacterium]